MLGTMVCRMASLPVSFAQFIINFRLPVHALARSFLHIAIAFANGAYNLKKDTEVIRCKEEQSGEIVKLM